MPPKRRGKRDITNASTSPRVSNSKKENQSPTPPSPDVSSSVTDAQRFLCKLYEALITVSSSNKRSLKALEAIRDSKCFFQSQQHATSSSSNLKDPPPLEWSHDANLIIITTHILNILITQFHSNPSIAHAQTLTLLSNKLVEILLSDRNQLELLIHPTFPISFSSNANLTFGYGSSSATNIENKTNDGKLTKSIVARAFITCIYASLLSLQYLAEHGVAHSVKEVEENANEEDDKKNDILRLIMWRNLSILEELIMFPKKSNDSKFTIDKLVKSTTAENRTISSTTQSNSIGIPSHNPKMMQLHNIPITDKSYTRIWNSVSTHILEFDLKDIESGLVFEQIVNGGLESNGKEFFFSITTDEYEAFSLALGWNETNDVNVEANVVLNNDSTIIDAADSSAPARKRRRTRSSTRIKKSPKSEVADHSVAESNSASDENITAPSSDLAKRLEQILNAHSWNNIVIDGRINIKRWAGMIFCWLFSGQSIVLDVAHTLLQSKKNDDGYVWGEIMTPSPLTFIHSSHSKDPTVSPKKKKKKSQSNEYLEQNNESKIPISGSLSLVLYIVHIIDVIHESGKMCSARPPLWGMDIYAASLLPNVENTSTMDCDIKDKDSSERKQTNRSARTKGAATKKKSSLSSNIFSSNDSLLSLSDDSYEFSTLNALQDNTTRWTRPDIRNKAALTIEMLLKIHAYCLRNLAFVSMLNEACIAHPIKDNFEDPFESDNEMNTEGRIGYMILNQNKAPDDSSLKKSLEPNSTEELHVAMVCSNVYPHLHSSIESLAKGASSSMNDSSYSDIPESMSHLMAFGASLSLKYCMICVTSSNLRAPADEKSEVIYDKVIVIDGNLCSLSTYTLCETLNKILSMTNTSNDIPVRVNKPNISDQPSIFVPTTSIETLVKEYNLDKPLTLFETEENKEVFTGIFPLLSRDGKCEIESGVTSSSASSQDEIHTNKKYGDFLAVYLRAMIPDDKMRGVDQFSSAIARLMKTLQCIIRCCYALPRTDIRGLHIVGLPFFRCALATGCLDTIRKLILQLKPSASISISSLEYRTILSIHLRASLRHYCLAIKSVLEFIALGKNLDGILIQRRFDLVCKLKDGELNQDNLSSLGSIFDFDQWERLLWNAHIKSNITIGRGKASYESRVPGFSSPSERSCLGTSSDKLSFFQAIAASSTALRDNKDHWPLYLPGVHHALVSSNLAADPIPRTLKEGAPEKFICDGFVSSISAALDDPCIIVEICHHPVKKHIQISDEVTPLSLRDSQLFCVALCRLPKKDRTRILSKLILKLHSSLSNMKMNNLRREVFISNKEVSGFLARVIVLISTLVDLIAGGERLIEYIYKRVGPSHYYLPSLIDLAQSSDTSVESDWYKREACFMGIFSDWESPASPPVSLADFTEPLTNKDASKLSSALSLTFGLAFETAKIDHCHLLFVVWNTSGKLAVWDTKPWVGPSTANELLKIESASNILRIREDVCRIYFTLDGANNIPESFLSKVLKKKRKNVSLDRLHGENGLYHLKSGIREIIDLLQSYEKDTNDPIISNEMSCSKFAAYEAAAAYASFLVSMLTQIPDDGRRKNSNASADSFDDRNIEDDTDESGDSDGGYPDFDDDEDDEAKLDFVSRLHDVCNTLGAAPIYPDWLDSTCSLRPGISEAFVVDSAESLLRVLTNFGLAASMKYTNKLKEALQSSSSDRNEQTTNNSELSLLIMASLDQNDNYPEDEQVVHTRLNTISEACGVSQDILGVSLDRNRNRSILSVKEAFLPNSSQRVKGKLQEFTSSIDNWLGSMQEYRANDEWEFLLSETLLGACTNILPSDSSKFSTTSKLINEAASWARVLHSLVSCMVTVTALLRFGVNHGKGRSLHHLAIWDLHYMKTEAGSRSPSLSVLSDKPYPSLSLTKNQLQASVQKAIGFLIELSACGYVGRSIRLGARSAVSHLVVSDKDLIETDDIMCIRNNFLAISAIVDVYNYTRPTSNNNALERILEKYGVMIDRILRNEDIDDPIHSQQISNRVMTCLGINCKIATNTIVESNLDIISMLSLSSSTRSFSLDWKWNIYQKEVVKLLASIAFGQSSIALHSKSRCKTATLLKMILLNERQYFENANCPDFITGKSIFIRLCVLEVFNNMNHNMILDLVRNDICVKPTHPGSDVLDDEGKILVELSRNLCYIIALLVGSIDISAIVDSIQSKACTFVLKCIRENIKTWIFSKNSDYVLYLLCVLATRFNVLKDVSSELISLIVSDNLAFDPKPTEFRKLKVIESFLLFLRDARSKILREDDTSYKLKVESLYPLAQKSVKKPATKLRTCTFVLTGGDFSEQYWYNCYTCGLLWDKGCCSLCAQVCHKGHDVGFCRKSSFFCDCGAEVSTYSDRPSCKCLSPVSDEVISSINSSEQGDSINCALRTLNGENCDKENEEKMAFLDISVELAVTCFPSHTLSSLEQFIDAMSSSELANKLFGLFNKYFDTLAHPDFIKSQLCLRFEGEKYLSSRETTRFHDLSLQNRDSKILDLYPLQTHIFSAIRGSRVGSLITTKSSTESNKERSKRLLTLRNDIHRQLITADYRGRIIIAEPQSLLFCSGLSLTAIRHVNKPLDNHIDRHELCILGKVDVEFDVFGILLCPDQNRALLVWGLSDVSVFILNKACDSVVVRIKLNVELDPHDFENEFIIKAEFIPYSSGSMVVVYGISFVKVFDIRRASKNDSCHPIKRYSIGFDDLAIKTGVVINGKKCSTFYGSNTDCPDNVDEAKIVLLFDNGRIHYLHLPLENDKDGDEECIECIEGIKFPIAGVKRHEGITTLKGASATTLGEGSTLVYLRQSGILIYKCNSSPLIAFVLDQNFDITGSFELLPNVLTSEVLGLCNENLSVSGPFTNWTELGVVERDGSFFYRVSFVGKSTKTNQPNLINLEFNSDKVLTSKILWPHGKAIGVGLNLKSGFEGMAAFTGPFLHGSGTERGFKNQGMCFERTYLVAITSSGSLLFYGEDLPDTSARETHATGESIFTRNSKRRRALSESALSFSNNNDMESLPEENIAESSKPKFPLTVFENLINVSSRDELKYGGEGIGNDGEVVKKKLSMNSNEFFTSPSKEGCTLTISLRASDKNLSDIKDHLSCSKLAIVAVRVLVGSTTTDCIPRVINVMGRPIQCVQSVKRWYDIPMTDEEILLSVRLGFITIGISSSFEASKNPSIVDCIDVYAQEKDQLPNLFHNSKEDNIIEATNLNVHLGSISTPWAYDEAGDDIMKTSVLCSTHLCHLLRNHSSSVNVNTLQKLIEVTALESDENGNVRKHVINLLKEVESDVVRRQTFLDAGTLMGVSKTLKVICDIIERSSSSTRSSLQSRELIPVLYSCITSSLEIIKNRPSYYKDIMERIILNGIADASVANHAKRLLEIWSGHPFTAEIAAKLLELAINESVISSASFSSKFASFDMASDVLRSTDRRVVHECCSTLANVLKDMSFPLSAYQCDGCKKFPITGTRYILEEGHDIDLCQSCYNLGHVFATNHKFDEHTPVLIHGKTLSVANKEMTCAQVKLMHPVPIASHTLEHVRQEVGHNESTDSGDEDNAALQLALKLSLDTTCNEQMSNSFVKQKVFLKILDDLVMSLSGSNHPIIQHHIPVMDLLLSLVFHSHGDEEKSFLGKMMCNRICDQISKLTKTFLENDEPLSSSSRLMRYSFVLCLKCLVCLLTNNNIINDKEVIPDDSHQDAHIFEGSTVNEKTREKTDPRFICEEHGVPAVRRRCSHGENKDRRFYVCGMERKNRCKYFKWADSTPSLKPHEKQRSSDVSKHAEVSYNSDLQQTLWSLLTNGDRDSPLQVQLCNLLQNILKKFETNGSLDLNALIDLDEKTACNTKDATISYLSLFNEDKESEKEDFTDGVTLSFDKLGPLRSEAIGLPSQYSSFFRVNDSTFIETIVDLLSLVAMKSSTAVDSGASWKCWFAPLCEIISTNLSIKLRTQAKTMLKRLCGGRRAIYRRVRDHHVFGYLFSQLLLLCEQPLLAALSVKEKARRCGSMWMNPDWTWKTLPSGCFIGVEDLISEDSHTVNEMEKINKVLDDLISITKSRRKNWRHFCGLPKFPKNVRVTNCFNFLQDDGDIYDRSPYCLLLWIACALPVSKQIKVFQLMEVAFDSSHTPTSSSEPINQTGDDCGILSTGTDAGSDCEGSTPNNASSSSSYHPESIGPEEILLNGVGRFTTDDFFAFVYHFVLHGKDKEVRSLSSKVTQKLVKNLSTTQYDNLFYRLVALCQRDISELGCNATEYLSLLNALASDERILSSRYFKNIMSIILTCCIQQLTICLGIKSKSFNTLNMTLFEPELDKRNSQGKHMYDTASCARCHMRRPFFSNTHGTSGTSSSDEELKISWHPDQLRDFKKSRLDTLALKTVNTEFSNHVQLKTRLSISEIHLAIGDPRGRFVKTIIVYFSPRPVGDVNELKAVEYKPFWQRIGTLSVARGAGQASLKLTAPVVAANLKFEYLEFYEKINSGRSSDGTLLLHCPRCTRIVNNSHGGVCGHCGEVAFQCRKCRHINYDRLDAFFCVECGYCASGNFSFELLSGFATRAVSIVDDEGLERAAKLLRFFNKRHYEMKNMLMSKLRDCDHTSKVMKSLVGNDALFASTYGAALEQSLLGNLPNTNRKGAEESSEKDLAKKRRVLTTNYNSSQRQNDLSSRSAANRARSLLSLARQIRNESNLDDRPTRGDILLQQAILHSGGALGNEDIFQDDDMEMVDYPPPERLQNADIPDPLSRLVANIQARVRGVNNVGEISNPTDPNRAGAGSTLTKDNDTVHETRKKSGSPPLVVEDYDKLYRQMRESEKECFDLRKKIVAWKRLNRDAVANCGSALSAINVCESYIPVTCSHCAPSIALNLLTLVTTLIENNIPNSEQALTRDFVAALFDGSPQEERELHDLKRSVIVTVATKSELGSQLVFHELQSRLHGGSDINSAEILGKLMENDFPSLGRFLDLAVTTLSKA